MTNTRILISGAGIAGLTLAWWLEKYGFDPVIVETAPTLREGGYMIDFWGAGFDVAEKMGLLQKLGQAHYNIKEIEFVNEKGKQSGGFQVEKLRKLVKNRHYSILRSDVARVLFDEVKDKVKFIWNNSISEMHQDESGVQVKFRDGTSDKYDLVVGTDGLHSKTRKLAWGPEGKFERFLGYYTASFTIPNFMGKDKIFKSYSVPGKQVGVYWVSNELLTTFFIFKADKKLDYNHRDLAEMQQILKDKYKDVGWVTPKLLEGMPSAPDFYFDSVSQIELDEWSKGRITLAGDSCQCVSLISGQGSALAIAGAYVLAGELKASGGNFAEAFGKYREIMIPEIRRKQKMAQDFAGSFVPDSKFGIWIRDKVTKLMFLPLVGKWFISQFMSDELVLKDYGAGASDNVVNDAHVESQKTGS